MKLFTTLFSIQPEKFRRFAFISSLKLHLFVAIAYGILGAAIHQATSGAPWAFGSLVILIGFILYSFVFAYSASQPKFLLRNNLGYFNRRRILEFDEEGFTSKFETGSHSFTVWTDVEMATYSNEITNLFLTRLFVVQIPDNAWPSKIELKQFHDLLRTKSLLK